MAVNTLYYKKLFFKEDCWHARTWISIWRRRSLQPFIYYLNTTTFFNDDVFSYDPNFCPMVSKWLSLSRTPNPCTHMSRRHSRTHWTETRMSNLSLGSSNCLGNKNYHIQMTYTRQEIYCIICFCASLLKRPDIL